MERGDQLGRLWKEYQQGRVAAKAARENAMATISADYAERLRGTEEWYRKTRELVLDSYALTSTGKKNEMARLDLKRAQEQVAWNAEAGEKRSAARSANPLPSWVTFLAAGSCGRRCRSARPSEADRRSVAASN